MTDEMREGLRRWWEAKLGPPRNDAFMVDDATYFWPESDGWRYVCGFLRIGPFKTFADCLANWKARKVIHANAA